MKPYIYGPDAQLSMMAHDLLASLNLLYIIGDFVRAMRDITPHTDKLHLDFVESTDLAVMKIKHRDTALHIQVLEKPCVRSGVLILFLFAHRLDGYWYLELPHEHYAQLAPQTIK